MPKRKFQFSKELQRVVEVTDDEVKSLCDEITEDAQKRSEHFLSEGKRHCTAGNYPYASDAMGVNPGRIPEAQRLLAEHGVKTEYTATGEPIIRDKAHRKAHCRALGFWDRDSGYSDPEPLNFTMDYHPDTIQRQKEEFLRRLADGKLL